MKPRASDGEDVRKARMTAYVFLGILAVFGLVVGLTQLPLSRAVNLTEVQSGALGTLKPGGAHWYRLEAQDYRVGETLDAVDVSNPTFRFHSTRYTYYRVSVHMADGTTVDLPVCVRGKKAGSMARGEAVSLYGTLSKTRESVQNRMGGQAPVCLNDAGDSLARRWITAGVYFALSAAAVFVILRIRKR